MRNGILAGFAVCGLAALLAVPADETRAHTDSSGTHHAETYPLHKAAEVGDLDSVNHFLTDHTVAVDMKTADDDETALHFAAFYGRAAVVSALIAAEANVTVRDRHGETPLHYAADRGHAAAVSALIPTLIAAGADLNVKNYENAAPLLLAAYKGHVAVVAALIAAGADVNVKNYDNVTPLHEAASNGHVAVVSALIAAGADVNVKTDDDETPLHYAAFDGHVAVVLALIAADADVNVIDDYGETPLHYAVSGGDAAAVSELIAAGAHWGEACAKPAVVNPAGDSEPCLCESPNVGTPDNCACPARQFLKDGACASCPAGQILQGGVCAPCPVGQGILADGTCGVCTGGEGVLADQTCGACPAGAAAVSGVCRCAAGQGGLRADNTCGACPVEQAPMDGVCLSVWRSPCVTAGWSFSADADGGSCGVLLTLAGGTAADRCYVSGAAEPQCEKVFGSTVNYFPSPTLAADGATLRFVYNCDPDGESGLIPATANTIAATECGCESDASFFSDVCIPEEGDLGLADELLCGAFGGTVQTATGGREVCSGMDANDTFCIMDSAAGFPCRGLFKHLRSCNVKFNRKALNPFFCGENCGVQKAVGSECR